MNPAFFSHETKKASPEYSQDQQQQTRPQPVKAVVIDSTQSSTALTLNPIINLKTPYKHSKLDGVLYHFYSKTLTVITNCRLTHYDAGMLDSSQSAPATPNAESSSFKKRPNKWFELEVADYDIFREEVRFWRNISTMIPSTILEGPTLSNIITEPCYVPPMILDIILDTSSLSEKDILTMEQSSPGPSRRKRRVRVDGKDSSDSSRRDSTDRLKADQSAETSSRHGKPIVLESWKVEMGVCNPADAPDLPILYRQATTHLKELSQLAKQLPASSMFMRLQKGKGIVKKAGTETLSDTELLKMGVRLGAEKVEDGEKDAGICGLREPLGPPVNIDEGKAKVTEIFNFQPLVTAIGIIQCSVEYRIDSDFYVEDMDVVMNMRDLELDEDYFRPIANPQLKAGGEHSTILTLSPTSKAEDGSDHPPQFLLSTTASRRQSTLTSQGIPILNGAATPSPPAESTIRSSGTGPAPSASTSVFSAQSTSGRPVAGLANLRRSPSITAHGSSPTTTMTPIGGTGTSSPSTTTVLGTDAAFLTHGRRTSTTERRLRTLNTLSGSTEKNNSPQSSSLVSTPPSSRPILARTSASAIPYGSFSPSSPSPLAQQLSAQQPMSSQSSFRMSSSPIYRNASLPFSASPNLRSVFQYHNPSHSQNSISSLSRTPPKFITDGSSATHQSSLGLHSTTTTTQGSPSQSSLAEGRQPSVAPQMIKRYSSTFNYRQGRRASSGIIESSIESDIGVNAPYSKSWQARIEQRQMFTARSLGREEGSHFSTGGSGTGGASFTSSYSPQAQRQSVGTSNSQEEDLDDFVRMIDTNHPVEASSSSVGQLGSINSVENLNQKANVVNYTIASSGVGFTRQYGWNRNQVDEMLNKMQNSVREFSTLSTSRGSGASGGANSSSGGSGRSAGMLGGSDGNSPVNQGLPVIQSVSPSFVRSPLSKVGFSATTFTSSGMRVPGNSASTRGSLQADRSSLAYRYNLLTRRDIHTETTTARPQGSNLTSSDIREEQVEQSTEDLEDEPRSRHARRTTSGGSLELYANQPHSYDPLEDEAVGRLELLQDDLPNVVQESEGAGVPIMGGGHHHHHHTHHQHHDSATSEAAERRRVDIELARNFGQVVSSSSNRGNQRASLSPWRNRIHSQSNNRGGANPGSGSAGLHTT